MTPFFPFLFLPSTGDDVMNIDDDLFVDSPLFDSFDFGAQAGRGKSMERPAFIQIALTCSPFCAYFTTTPALS